MDIERKSRAILLVHYETANTASALLLRKRRLSSIRRAFPIFRKWKTLRCEVESIEVLIESFIHGVITLIIGMINWLIHVTYLQFVSFSPLSPSSSLPPPLPFVWHRCFSRYFIVSLFNSYNCIITDIAIAVLAAAVVVSSWHLNRWTNECEEKPI